MSLRLVFPGVGALLLLTVSSVQAEAARYVVEIKNMAFGPPPAHLMVGDVLQWKNSDIFRHSATAAGGAFDLDLEPGAHGDVTLKKAGTLAVHCRYHPNMTLTLTVAKAKP